MLFCKKSCQRSKNANFNICYFTFFYFFKLKFYPNLLLSILFTLLLWIFIMSNPHSLFTIISQFNVLAANQLSNDQSIKTSATLLNKYGSVVALGYNGMPYGMDDNNLDYQNKVKGKFFYVDDHSSLPIHKKDWFEHAEQNMLFNFVRDGISFNLSSKNNQDENYLLLSNIETMGEARCIASIGVRRVIVKHINLDIFPLVAHLFKTCNIDWNMPSKNLNEQERKICGTDFFWEYLNHDINLNAHENQKLSKLFNMLDNSNQNNPSVKYAALFSKQDALIAIGYDGLSDCLRYKIQRKISGLKDIVFLQCKITQSTSEKLDVYDKMLNEHTFQDQNGINVSISASAVQNMVANMLANVIDDNYSVITSFPSCLDSYVFMLSSGINPQNIHVHPDWQTILPDITESKGFKNTKYKWQIEHQNGLKLAEFLM